MIFIDTNVLLYTLTGPETPEDLEMRARSYELLSKVAAGTIRATTNDVVLHEVCWVLGSKTRYGHDPKHILDIMESVLSWPGWWFLPGDLELYRRALIIFAADPRLQFSDAIIAARAEALGAELATFDRRLAKAYSGTTWPRRHRST